MGNKMNLTDCIELARFAHRNQYDKAGAPYIEHPLRVLASVQAQGAQPYVQMAAVLHDVTEDTPFTPEMLLAFGVPEAAVRLVELLDRNISREIYARESARHVGYTGQQFGTTKDEFYYAGIRKNPGASLVKLSDIGDNTQPWRLSYLPKETQERLLKKYADAVAKITGG